MRRHITQLLWLLLTPFVWMLPIIILVFVWLLFLTTFITQFPGFSFDTDPDPPGLEESGPEEDRFHIMVSSIDEVFRRALPHTISSIR